MAADGEEVHPQVPGGEGHLEKGLDGVGVEKGGGAGGPDGLRGLLHRQDGAQLVVHQHHGHQHRVRPQGGGQVLGVDVALAVGAQPGHLIALIGQGADRLQHGGVLDGGGDDVAALPPAVLHGGPNGPVVPLGAAGGENELLRQAAHRLRHRGPVGLKPLRRRRAVGVPGGRVPEVLRHGGQSGLGRLGAHPGGGRVVQIDHVSRAPYLWLK